MRYPGQQFHVSKQHWRKWLNRSCGKVEKQPTYCCRILPVTPSFCSVVGLPCIIAVWPECPSLECCSLWCLWEGEEEISHSVCLQCQNVSQLHFFLGFCIFFSSFMVIFIHILGVPRKKHRVVSLGHLFQPSLDFWSPSSASCLTSVSLLWNSGLSQNYYFDEPFGLTIMVSNQKGWDGGSKSYPTLNSWGLFLLYFKSFSR